MEELSVLLTIIGFVGLMALFAYLRSPSRKGRKGEEHVGNELLRLPAEYVIINDIVLPTSRGTTQIAHIVVSPYGIFGIETKNYRGEIYGNDDRQEWTQKIVTNVTYSKKLWKTYTYVTKNNFYNPVKQSLGHIFALKEYLKDFGYVPMIPVVVFVGDAVLTNVCSRYPVVYFNSLVPEIRRHEEKRYLTDEQVKEVVSRINALNVRETVKNSEHVNNIRKSSHERNLKVAEGICPRCGGNLVLRQGKYGSFYGCSNYPKCRFTCER